MSSYLRAGGPVSGTSGESPSHMWNPAGRMKVEPPKGHGEGRERWNGVK